MNDSKAILPHGTDRHGAWCSCTDTRAGVVASATFKMEMGGTLEWNGSFLRMQRVFSIEIELFSQTLLIVGRSAF